MYLLAPVSHDYHVDVVNLWTNVMVTGWRWEEKLNKTMVNQSDETTVTVKLWLVLWPHSDQTIPDTDITQHWPKFYVTMNDAQYCRQLQRGLWIVATDVSIKL